MAAKIWCFLVPAMLLSVTGPQQTFAAAVQVRDPWSHYGPVKPLTAAPPVQPPVQPPVRQPPVVHNTRYPQTAHNAHYSSNTHYAQPARNTHTAYVPPTAHNGYPAPAQATRPRYVAPTVQRQYPVYPNRPPTYGGGQGSRAYPAYPNNNNYGIRASAGIRPVRTTPAGPPAEVEIEGPIVTTTIPPPPLYNQGHHVQGTWHNTHLNPPPHWNSAQAGAPSAGRHTYPAPTNVHTRYPAPVPPTAHNARPMTNHGVPQTHGYQPPNGGYPTHGGTAHVPYSSHHGHSNGAPAQPAGNSYDIFDRNFNVMNFHQALRQQDPQTTPQDPLLALMREGIAKHLGNPGQGQPAYGGQGQQPYGQGQQQYGQGQAGQPSYWDAQKFLNAFRPTTTTPTPPTTNHLRQVKRVENGFAFYDHLRPEVKPVQTTAIIEVAHHNGVSYNPADDFFGNTRAPMRPTTQRPGSLPGDHFGGFLGFHEETTQSPSAQVNDVNPKYQAYFQPVPRDTQQPGWGLQPVNNVGTSNGGTVQDSAVLSRLVCQPEMITKLQLSAKDQCDLCGKCLG